MIVGIVRKNKNIELPNKAHVFDAGFDICASENVELLPQDEPKLISTGLVIALPKGYAGLILPRSGLAAKFGVTVTNSPGLIDAGYRGEIFVGLVNHHPTRTHLVSKGDKIAQLLIVPFANAYLAEMENEKELDRTFPSLDDRGTNGFGSSGK